MQGQWKELVFSPIVESSKEYESRVGERKIIIFDWNVLENKNEDVRLQGMDGSLWFTGWKKTYPFPHPLQHVRTFTHTQLGSVTPYNSNRLEHKHSCIRLPWLVGLPQEQQSTSTHLCVGRVLCPSVVNLGVDRQNEVQMWFLKEFHLQTSWGWRAELKWNYGSNCLHLIIFSNHLLWSFINSFIYSVAVSHACLCITAVLSTGFIRTNGTNWAPGHQKLTA